MVSIDFERARTFIYSSGRLLERRLFAALFEQGPREAVHTALRAYQNEDGGFGNALEGDLRTPASQPLAVERAWVMLDLIDGFDDPMVGRACDWLETVTTPEGGVPFALTTLEGYPHTPWMQGDDHTAGLNPTAGLCGLLFKHGVRHAWVDRAADYCWRTIPGFESDFYHDLMPVIDFLEHTPERRDQAQAELERLRAHVARPGVVALDPQAEGYVKYPLDWAPRPDSFLHSLFDEHTLAVHLDALAARQQPDGGWPINWEALSPAAEAEWRGWVTIDALCKLRAYGRLG
ncbi:MAG: prenyltransferase/squalene oxidase repeat-containing protein [Anaerolineaceae bacterium]|nr:prenyltransferase/squalene oxidase repeat-containing protein [Anaerolineaceae bacterium]